LAELLKEKFKRLKVFHGFENGHPDAIGDKTPGAR